MNKICFIITSIFILSAYNSSGQEDIQTFSEPDTVKPFRPHILNVLNLDSLKPIGTTIDTLTNPDGLVFQSGVNYICYIALKEKNFYQIFYAGGEDGQGVCKPQRISFTSKGNKFLLLKYYYNEGNSHFTEYHEGLCLWDLDNIQELMEVTYYYSHWVYPRMEQDSAGNYYQVDTNDSGTKQCYHFEPVIKKGIITFTETIPECEWDKNSGTSSKIINPKIIKYRLTDVGLVKSKL